MFNANVMQTGLEGFPAAYETVSVQLLKEDWFHEKCNFYECHTEIKPSIYDSVVFLQ
jgi:hypothetical protein